jgi:REP element-mobilizing transposase RayT
MKSGSSSVLVCRAVALQTNVIPQYNCGKTEVDLAVARPLTMRLWNEQPTMTNSYRVFNDKHYAYFVTWTLVDCLPLFAQPAYRQIALDSLNYLRTNKRTQLNAFVVMPSHIHAVHWPDDGINLSDVTRDFKRFTSREISREARRQGSDQFIKVFEYSRLANRAQDVSQYQVWQEGSHPEAIFTEIFAEQKIDYIHLNPVRAGFVQAAHDWPFSSARAYFLGEETYPLTDLLMVG